MTPTPESPAYDELVAAIVKAVPEISRGRHTPMWRDDFGECDSCGLKLTDELLGTNCLRDITLEDVLRANNGNLTELGVDDDGWFWTRPLSEWETTGEIKWHLGHDLAWHRDNAPETITFLHSLLCG